MTARASARAIDTPAEQVYDLAMRLLLACVLLAAGCSNAPSGEQCKQALDHLLELEVDQAGGNKGLTEEMKADLVKQKANVSEALRSQFMEACVKKTPRDVVECVNKAKTIDDAGKCDE
jgi:hypothetical protein